MFNDQNQLKILDPPRRFAAEDEASSPSSSGGRRPTPTVIHRKAESDPRCHPQEAAGRRKDPEMPRIHDEYQLIENPGPSTLLRS